MTITLGTLNGIQRELKTLGLSWPEAVLTRPDHPTIPEPTEQEFVDAVNAADGDPANDPTVQTLINRMALIRFGHVNAVMSSNHERKRGALVPAAAKELASQLQELHAREVETLAEALKTIPTNQHAEDIRLEGLAPHQYESTVGALTAQHRAKRIRNLWGKIRTMIDNFSPEMSGFRGKLFVLANPTPDQYRKALKESPVDFPTHADEWGILQHGWEVKLADSGPHALQRRNALRDATDQSRNIASDEAGVV